MYRIYADDTLIYDSTLEDYVITKGQITREVNKSGSFVFTMYEENPFYNRIKKLKTIITVYKGDELIFRGRVINEKTGFYNDKTFTCEGELSFLLDSIQRPYEFNGSPADLFKEFINNHNAQVEEEKQFVIGTITVTDDNDYINRANSDYTDTLSNINDKLIGTHGGYIHISRNTSGKAVINWFKDYPYESAQKIEFGENLLDYMKESNGDAIATALIPLGAKIEGSEVDERLTIKGVNNDIDYVYNQTAVNTYGWIFAVEIWDDVTIESNLLTKANARLNELINQNITIELSAVDLSLMDQSIDSFSLGDYVRIVSDPHNMNDRFLLKKQTIDLLKPDNDKITLGYTYSTFTDSTLATKNSTSAIVKRVETVESNYVTNQTVTQEVEALKSVINQSSTAISSEVLAEYVLNDQLVASQSTLFTQLNESFEFMFNTLESTVNENDAEARREFSEIKKYIRFEDGNIILGESGNELTLKIQNDRISFYEGFGEVAYISDKKLYITDAEVLTSIRIGNFAFIPRANGNLSFKKVGG